jgi:branched-chain amino acid transport system permease protein
VIELALLALFSLLPLVLSDFWVLFGTKVFILGMLALSFDLVWGYAGIMSFGQGLFFGVPAYAAALAATKLGVTSPLVLLPGAALLGLLLALLVAWILILGKRATTIVFVAMGTLTGSYVVERLARGWSYVGGQNGISGLPRMTLGNIEIEEGRVFYYLALVLLLSIYLALRFLVRSQFGLVLAGVRQQEERIAFLGYRVQHFKAIVFSLAGAVAGLAGGLYVFHEGFIGPGQIGPVQSTQAVLYVLFGGVGTLAGALIGTGLLEYLNQTLSSYDRLWPVMLGVLLLLVVVFRPSGLIGFLVSERERIGTFGSRAARSGAQGKASS